MGKYWGKFFQYKYIVFHPFCKLSQKFSPVQQIFYCGVLKITFYVSTKTIWELFCEKKLIFHHFWTLSGKIYASFLKSFGGVVKTAFYLSTGTFRGKKIFSQQNEVFQKKQWLRENFSVIVKNFRQGCQNWIPYEHFPEKHWFWEKTFSSQFWTSSATVFVFCCGFLGWGFQGHLLRVLWKVLRDFFDFFFLSLSVEDTDWKNSGFFFKNLSTKLSKLHSRCPRENIGERFFIQNIVFFILFGQWAKSCRPFDKFFMAEFWKLHSTCPIRLWGFSCENKLNFYLFWILAEETLRLLPKKYRRGCENCIPSVHRNISRRPFYEKKKYFITFGCFWRVARPLP